MMRLSLSGSRRLAILASLILFAALASFMPVAGASAQGFDGMPIRSTATRFMATQSAQSQLAPSYTSSKLSYHGGPISTTSAVYISWWGPQWSSGFSSGGYSSAKAQTYIKGFFNNVGGSSWHRIDTQYCQGVAVGTINCGSSGQHITNHTGLLKGSWVDPTSVPTSPTQNDIINATMRLISHFGYHANAIYLIFTPKGHSMSGFGSSWCAWHSSFSSGGNWIAYGYIPYMPGAGSSCGMNYVNSTNNSYGNGYFDGFSIVAGHEFMEAETDMFPSIYVAWQGSGGAQDENADKCAWDVNGGTAKNITLGTHHYAVQPIWSNNSTTSSGSHCVTSHS